MTADFIAPVTTRDHHAPRTRRSTTVLVPRTPRLRPTPSIAPAGTAAARQDEQGSSPRLDEDDVLWRGRTWCALAPIEAMIVRMLIEHGPRVVSRDEIAARVWPEGAPKGRPVDGRLHRLRERLAPLGMHIHSIRQRGLLLAVDPRD